MLLDAPKVLGQELENKLIFGQPIETYYGRARFYTYTEFLERQIELNYISTTILGFYYAIRRELIKQKATKEDLIELKKMQEVELFDFVRITPFILEAYKKIFHEVFELPEEEQGKYLDTDFYITMDKEDFYNMRDIVMRINLLKEEVMSPSPRVQDRFDREKERKRREAGEGATIETVLSTLTLFTGKDYQELGEMTAYQILNTYQRVHAFGEFFITTLFKTAGAEVDIAMWDKNHTMLEENKPSGMTATEFNKKFGSMGLA